MALAQEKKGSRYTKREQEERKLQVYEMHFEQAKSATEIAELLNVNYNTINDDIKYWYSTITDETSSQTIISKFGNQIDFMNKR